MWGAIVGVIAGGLAGWFIPVGIGSINAMLIAVLCYMVGRGLQKTPQTESAIQE